MESCFPPQRLLGSWLHHANESKVFKLTPQPTVSFSFAPCGKRIPGKGNTRAGEAGERAGRCGQGVWGGEGGAELGMWAVFGSKGGQQGCGGMLAPGGGGGATKRDNIGVFTLLTRPEILEEGGGRKNRRGLLSDPSRVLLPRRRLTPGAGCGPAGIPGGRLREGAGGGRCDEPLGARAGLCPRPRLLASRCSLRRPQRPCHGLTPLTDAQFRRT